MNASASQAGCTINVRWRSITFLLLPRRLRASPRSWSSTTRRRARLRERSLPESVLDVGGHGRRVGAGAGGSRAARPRRSRCSVETGRRAAVRAPAARAQRAAADAPRPRRGGAAPPAPTRRRPRSRPRRWPASAPRSTRADFVEVHTPKIVAAATESGANVFPVDYFGRPAYLAQSPQFYKQIMVGVFERVYEVGPVFRAEPHDTARHLAEYVSLDAEMGFIRDHRDVMAVLRDVLAGMVDAIARARPRTRSRCSSSASRRAGRDPVDPLRRRAGDDRARHRRADRRRARPGARARALAGRVGRARARLRLPVRRRLPDGQAAVLHPPRPGTAGGSRTASTCCSAGSSWSPAASACTATRTTSPRSAGARTSRPTRATSRRSATACRRTAASPSAWSAGSARLTGAANIREITLFPRDLHRLTPCPLTLSGGATPCARR